jgi:hypothetical protein
VAILRWDQVVEVTHDQAKQELLDQLQGLGFTATSWQKFSIPSLLVGIGAEIIAKSSKVAVFLKSLALNETSEGESLTRFSRSHYANEREEAVAAQRRITLACTATEGPHAIGLGDVVITHSDGTTFRNVAGLSVIYPAALPSGGTLPLLFEAEVAGTAGNFTDTELVTAGSLVTTMAGVSIVSDFLDRAGVDEEDDDRLKVRNSSKWARIGEFELIRDRVINIALEAAPAVTIVEVDDQNPRGAGTFDIYLAGDSTTAGTSDVALVQAAFDLRVLGQYADGAVPRGYARPAPETLLDVAGTVYYLANFSLADVQAAIEGAGPTVKGALQTFVESVPLGGFDFAPGPSHVVRETDLNAAIKAATVAGQSGAIRTVVVSAPVGDTAISSFGKVRLGTVALSYVPIDVG